jgi:NADH-quinone oxidoreductase subunit M
MLFGLPLLSLVVWVPIAAGIVILASGPDRNAQATRWLALAGSLLGLLVALPLWGRFDPSAHGFQLQEVVSWIPRFNIHYHLGIDGISLLLILLNCITTVLVVIAGWKVIATRVAQYMAAFLILSGLMNGVFCALDAALFYVFFEATLIPMFIIIDV